MNDKIIEAFEYAFLRIEQYRLGFVCNCVDNYFDSYHGHYSIADEAIGLFAEWFKPEDKGSGQFWWDMGDYESRLIAIAFLLTIHEVEYDYSEVEENLDSPKIA